MSDKKDKKSVFYITVDCIVTTRESFMIKHGNRVAAEKLAEKGKVDPFYSAQVSNHRKLKFTMEIPENMVIIKPIDGEDADG